MRKLLSKTALLTMAVGIVLGILLLAAFRFATYKDDHVHYHANFALFIDGKRDEFKSPLFYEEVQLCGGNADNPRARTHMHNNKPFEVHVHDRAVTWADFFANLGYSLSDNAVQTDKNVYADSNDGQKLSFILNGKPVDQVANKVIQDKDVLLVSYGTEDAEGLQTQYKAIPHTAAQLDAGTDPASCSGGEKVTFTKRLKAAFGLETASSSSN
jgi:hypothetical protein